MRKVYILMAAAAVVMVGCKNNGNKKAGEGVPEPVDEVVEVVEETVVDATTTDEEVVRAEIEKIVADQAAATVESVEEILSKDPDAAIPFQLVENKPAFDGGDANEFSKWVNSHLDYPQAAIDDQIQGRVVLGFTVDKDGAVKNVEVLRGVNELLDNEAVRVVTSSPKWEPATQNGNPVAVKYTFPVVFKLQ